jgi:hypothetical protein
MADNFGSAYALTVEYELLSKPILIGGIDVPLEDHSL